MKTELQIIMDALQRQGIDGAWDAFNGIIRVDGARLHFKPDGELDYIRGNINEDDED